MCGLTPFPSGNLTNDGVRVYSWDEQDRLIEVQDLQTSEVLLQNRYDGLSRRRERVQLEDGVLVTNHYVYDGWLVMAVLNGENEVLEQYMHGMDLSGSREGAGGIGGILHVSPLPGGAGGGFFHYDGNGNVASVTDSEGAIISRYEYDPFGRVLLSDGDYTPRYQFSTKEYDATVGLNFYGHRFYNPELGRWLNRDPIEEAGGYNLYAMVYNNALSWYDRLGRQPETTPPGRRIPRPSPSEIARCVARAGLDNLVSRYDQAFDRAMFCGRLGRSCTSNMGFPDPSNVDFSGLVQGSRIGRAIRSITSCLADTLGDFVDLEITLEFEIQDSSGVEFNCSCPTEEKEVSFSFNAVAKLVAKSGTDSLTLREYPSQPISDSCGAATWNSCCQF